MSNFVVSARKYRPQRFDEVVGQQHISQTLKNALQSDHLAHAFLFCGPRGVGKTTCARILAKTLNCLQPSADFEPCNTCDNCQSFSKNASFNITELDAASNNSVEHIRALIEQVRFQPQQGKYKVFIIDEVHMLSQAAFNAFLKTLEEPPSYAIFILATTEKHKIIPTILSRCQIYDFKRIQVPDVVAHLADICAKEGIAADADALHVIGQKADGALRDALSIFDRIVSFSGKAISYQDVITNLNVLDYDYFFRVVDALLAEDLQQILLIYDDIDRKGFEGDLFINGLAQHVRNLLVCKDEQTLVLLDVGDGLRERYRQQATLCGNDFLLTALNLANDCDINYRMARNKRLQVEMTLVKMASIGRAFQLGSQPQAPAQEKKTADVTQPITAPGQPIPYIAPANASPHVVQEEPQKTYTTPTNGQASNAAAPAAAPAATPIPVLETANTLAKADLGAMMAAIKAEREEVVQRAHPVNLAEVQAAWDAYAAQVERDSLRYQLQSVQLELEGMTITAKVGSALVEGALRQETALTGQLRQQLKAPDLMLRIHIDPAMRKEEPEVQKTKLLTPNEKYKLMSEVNPDVRILIDTFELKPEN